MDKIVALCKRRGFVFASSEIYGGLGSTYDYGHYGVLLKTNVKNEWWRAMLQERDDIVALDSRDPPAPARRGRPAGTSPASPTRWSTAASAASASAPTTSRELACPEKPSKHPGEGPNCDLTEARDFNLMFETTMGPGEGVRRDRLPAPRDRAGHLRELQERPAVLAQEAAVRHRAGRQVVPQRDHARQLHLPHARVRADGDGVLRPARRGAAVVRALEAGALRLVRPSSGSAPTTCSCASTIPTSSATTRPAPPTSSTSSRSAGRSSRASPTAATSTSPSTRSSPARSSSTSTSSPASATSRTSSSPPPAPTARRSPSSSTPTTRRRSAASSARCSSSIRAWRR